MWDRWVDAAYSNLVRRPRNVIVMARTTIHPLHCLNFSFAFKGTGEIFTCDYHRVFDNDKGVADDNQNTGDNHQQHVGDNGD
jgi:hypothetical protein